MANEPSNNSIPPQQTEPAISESSHSQPSTRTPSPWNLPAGQAAFLFLFALTVTVSVFLRFFQLDTLQAEVYGDIDIVLGYMREVLNGHWPTNFVLSAGPLYHYLIAPVIYLTGQNYEGAKVASALVSLAGLAATYAFSRRLINDHFAVLTLFIAGVSSWLLIFSRLGNSQIALPLLTMLTLWLVIRVVQFGRQRDVIICAVVSSLGLFIYPQSFIQPGVIFVTLLCLGLVKQPLPKKWALTYILASLPGVIFFAYVFFADPANFNGYIGSKFHAEGNNNAVLILIENITKALLAFHVRGDEGFRSNPTQLPHLDWVSGLFVIAGILFWLTSKEKRRWIPIWLVPLILLQVPSVLVLSQPGEVPSASRTLGVSPIVYMLVASGIWWVVQILNKHTKRWITVTVVGLLLGSILVLNAQRYFQNYISGLPYNNTPVAKILATYANMLPSNTQIYTVGCCWADGVPDNFMQYDMIYPENLHNLTTDGISCTQLQNITQPAVFFWNFNNASPAPQLDACKDWLTPQLFTYQNMPIFNTAFLHVGKLDPSIHIDTLVHGEVQVNGETIRMDYSPIDMGNLDSLFDKNTDSLIRGNGVNPMVLVLHFSPPRKMSSIDLTTGSMSHFKVTLTVTYTDNTSQNIENDYQNLPDDPHMTIKIPESNLQVISLGISVTNLNPAANASDEHIHIRELELH